MNKYCIVAGCRYSDSHHTLGHLCGKCKKYGHGKLECDHYKLKEYLVLESKNNIFPIEKHCTINNCKFKHLHSVEAHHCKNCLQNHCESVCPLSSFKYILNFKLDCPICKVENIINEGFQKIYGCDNICCCCLENNVNIFLPKCGHVCLCFECMQKLNKNKNSDSGFKIYLENQLPHDVIVESKKIFKLLEGKIYTVIYGGMGCSWFVRRDFIDGFLLGVFLHSDCQGQYGINHFPLVDKFLENYEKIDNT